MKKRRVHAARTHFDVTKRVRVGDSDTRLKNSQGKQDMLIDPEDLESGPTHSQRKIRANNAMSDTIIDDELDFGPVSTHAGEEDEELPIEKVPAVGEVDGVDEDQDLVDDEIVSSDEDEFQDLGDTEVYPTVANDGDDECDDLGLEEAEFESDDPLGESVPLVDADNMDDSCEGDELTFATIANHVHVIASNRIIASIGKVSASRAGVGDIYTTTQYQDVVLANIGQKGLRKGLVQSGFVLAKVKLKADKSVNRVVQAKIQAGIQAKVSSMKRNEKALDQAMAIAAVGINKKFFKGAENPLKAYLEAELVNMGVRGGQQLVRAAFAKYGVDYGKAIHTLARKISAMPEEMRDTYADALDMTDEDYTEEVDSDVEDELGVDDSVDENESFDQIPASVNAAMLRPIRRGPTVQASSKTAQAILSGTASLVY